MEKHSIDIAKNTSSAAVTVVGIDLARNMCALHGVNAASKTVLVKPNVRRDQLLDKRPLAMAIAAKNARMGWAILAKGQAFQPVM